MRGPWSALGQAGLGLTGPGCQATQCCSSTLLPPGLLWYTSHLVTLELEHDWWSLSYYRMQNGRIAWVIIPGVWHERMTSWLPVAAYPPCLPHCARALSRLITPHNTTPPLCPPDATPDSPSITASKHTHLGPHPHLITAISAWMPFSIHLKHTSCR